MALREHFGRPSISRINVMNEKEHLPVGSCAPPKSNDISREYGGSPFYDWNFVLADQAVSSCWTGPSPDDKRESQQKATLAALRGMAPKDELEGMMAAQLVAAHNAIMECYRRASLSTQSFEGRREALNQAAKLSRAYTATINTLNKYRGKGSQLAYSGHGH
jgi:hypothetical protein